MNDKTLRETVKKILEKEFYGIMPNEKPIHVGISGRHLHISQEDLSILFGENYKLTKEYGLSQPGQFAAKERVTLIGEKGVIENLRILGPVRKQTQIELSISDAIKLGISPPIRDSGDLAGSASGTIVGPKGSKTLKEGIIIAKRHIHMTPEDAKEYNVTDGEIVRVLCGDARKLIFDEVIIRVNVNYALDFHIDFDEANAAGLKQGDKCYLLKTSLGGGSPKKVIITKRLITEQDIMDAEKNGMKILLSRGTIITPLALDRGRAKGIIEDKR